jgi:hypothetical protein
MIGSTALRNELGVPLQFVSPVNIVLFPLRYEETRQPMDCRNRGDKRRLSMLCIQFLILLGGTGGENLEMDAL